MNRPTTIQIFLPHGEPRGIRMAELTTRVARAIVVPRNALKLAGERPELQTVGVYFLIGESEEDAKASVYIGEAENCFQRLGQHNATKDFWNIAVVIGSKTDAFTKGHARYLEWLCVKKAGESGRFHLMNTTIPGEPYVPEPMLADLMDSFDTLRILLSTLGFPIFEPARTRVALEPGTGGAAPVEGEEVFYCTRNGADAKGQPTDEGFVVLAGSRALPGVAESAEKYIAVFREKLVHSGVLAPEGDALVFRTDYLFNSPSAASGIVLGRRSNGWEVWRLKDGRTLDEVKRKP